MKRLILYIFLIGCLLQVTAADDLTTCDALGGVEFAGYTGWVQALDAAGARAERLGQVSSFADSDLARRRLVEWMQWATYGWLPEVYPADGDFIAWVYGYSDEQVVVVRFDLTNMPHCQCARLLTWSELDALVTEGYWHGE